ncbi:MAG: MFS transporter [Actinomycetota bacterium]
MPLPEALAIAPYRTALVVTFVTNWILLGLRASILPLFITEQLHSSSTVLGFGFAVMAICQGFLLLPAGTISDERGRRTALLIGSTVVFTGTLFLVFAIHPGCISLPWESWV